MYYPDEIIEEVRMKNPIVDVIGSYVHLTKKGSNYFGLCPFHNEKTGSFSVSQSRQMYHCFGCGAGGNVITFVMDYENLTFPEAVEALASRAGITLPKREPTSEEKKERSVRERMLAMHKDAAVFYCHMLKTPEGKIGLDYFKKRGVSDEMIRSFGLGYGSTKPNALYLYLRSKGYRDDELKNAGLATIYEKGGGRDRFWNRVIFPIMDVQNRVIGFGGRVIGQGEPKYLNSPETKIFDKSRNLYGLNAAKRTREKYFLVCEGYMDVIAMHQAGFTNAVASLGTAFTPQHGMILKRYIPEVILCYDTDGPGKKAALRAIPILKEAGLRVKVLDMAPYKDPDEFLQSVGKEKFEERIAEAENGFLFQMRMARESYDFSDPDDKTAFIHEAAKALSEMDDAAERNSYMEAVAKRFMIDFAVLRSKTIEFGNKKGLIEPPANVRLPKRTTTEKAKPNGGTEAEKLLLTILSEKPEWFGEVRSIVSSDDFTEGTHRSAAQALYEQLESGRTVSPAAILDRFVDDETYPQVAALFSSTFSEDMDEDQEHSAVREAAIRVRLMSLDRELASVSDPARLVALVDERKHVESLKP